MASIDTIEDFIRIMDENPQWLEAVRARLLTRELLALPQRFDALEGVVQQLAAAQANTENTLQRFMESTNARLDAQDATIAQILETQARMLETQTRHETTIAQLVDSHVRLEETVGVMKQDIDSMKDDIGVMKGDIYSVKGDLYSMKGDIYSMRDDIYSVKGDLYSMKGDHDSMKGDHMEMRLQGRIHGLLATRLGMRRVRVARALYPAGDLPAFDNAVHEAEERDDITEEQYTRLMNTDLIASARRRGSTQEVYVPVEVSNRLDREDVDRAVKSAEALAGVYPDAEVLPAVYGSEMSEQDRLYANDRGVEVFMMRSRR